MHYHYNIYGVPPKNVKNIEFFFRKRREFSQYHSFAFNFRNITHVLFNFLIQKPGF